MLQQIAPKEQRSSNTLHTRCLLKWHKTRNIKASDMKAYEKDIKGFCIKCLFLGVIENSWSMMMARATEILSQRKIKWHVSYKKLFVGLSWRQAEQWKWTATSR